MVFKRRTPKTWALWVWNLIWPQGGWARAFYYVKHRLHRLPDDPKRIARGIAAGIFTTFTPFFGIHFFIAAIVARGIKGNMLASLMATFFGNPLTYLPIGVISLQTGHFLLGTEFQENSNFGIRFVGAARDMRDNFYAIFTDAVADWTRLASFYDEVFFPYLIGGIIPGFVAGTACYYLSVPVITAYQNRRRGRLKAKFAELKARQAAKKAIHEPCE